MIRTRNLYQPGHEKPFSLSRSKLELFIDCPRCFYLDRRRGVSRVPGFAFNLNLAVDSLLKNEFDNYRLKKQPHPLMVENHIDAIPYSHPDLEKWRNSLSGGIEYLDTQTNFKIKGGIDDVWVDSQGRLLIVDYKATSKKGPLSMSAPWQLSYKRQVEIYQWLFAKNGFDVAPESYFVYCNGLSEKTSFDAKLHFEISVFEHQGSWDWIDLLLVRIKRCLDGPTPPKMNKNCDWCQYSQALIEVGG